MRRVTDHQRIGLSLSLYPGGNVGGLAQCQLLLTPCSAHCPHNHEPRMDAQSESKLDTCLLLQTGIEVSHGFENTDPSTDCALGVIFMGVGIPKIDQETIP